MPYPSNINQQQQSGEVIGQLEELQAQGFLLSTGMEGVPGSPTGAASSFGSGGGGGGGVQGEGAEGVEHLRGEEPELAALSKGASELEMRVSRSCGWVGGWVGGWNDQGTV